MAKSPLPQASSGLPSPVIGPMTRSTSARALRGSGGSSSPALARDVEDQLGLAAGGGHRRPGAARVGQRSPWQQASTSVISSRSCDLDRAMRAQHRGEHARLAGEPAGVAGDRAARALARARPSAPRRACRGRRRGRARPRSARAARTLSVKSAMTLRLRIVDQVLQVSRPAIEHAPRCPTRSRG